jgi:hypothetical protein
MLFAHCLCAGRNVISKLNPQNGQSSVLDPFRCPTLREGVSHGFTAWVLESSVAISKKSRDFESDGGLGLIGESVEVMASGID